MSPFKLGLNETHHDPKMRLYEPLHLDQLQTEIELGDDPPERASIDDYSPDNPDQNGVGACVMCGIPYGFATTLAANGTPLSFRPGVRDPYAGARGMERAVAHPVGKLPPLFDDGLQLGTGVAYCGKWGLTPMGPRVKYLNELVDCDCNPANCNNETDHASFAAARKTLIVGAYELSSSSDLDKSIQLAIAARHAVGIGGFVATPFFNYGPNSPPIGAQNLRDPDGGGHCTYLTAYKRPAVGPALYFLRNSWNKKLWGINGCAWVTSDFVQQMWSVWALRAQLVIKKNVPIGRAA